MIKKSVFRRVAKAEVQEAFDWYEKHEPGFGHRFIKSLSHTIQQIETFPKMFQNIKGDVRQALIKQFPYSILYIEEERRIVILAVFHQSRDPEIWEERL